MPMYEYLCEACGESFDKIFPRWQDATDKLECPNCDATAKKQLSKGSFVMTDEFGDSVSIAKK